MIYICDLHFDRFQETRSTSEDYRPSLCLILLPSLETYQDCLLSEGRHDID